MRSDLQYTLDNDIIVQIDGFTIGVDFSVTSISTAQNVLNLVLKIGKSTKVLPISIRIPPQSQIQSQSNQVFAENRLTDYVVVR